MFVTNMVVHNTGCQTSMFPTDFGGIQISGIPNNGGWVVGYIPYYRSDNKFRSVFQNTIWLTHTWTNISANMWLVCKNVLIVIKSVKIVGVGCLILTSKCNNICLPAGPAGELTSLPQTVTTDS